MTHQMRFSPFYDSSIQIFLPRPYSFCCIIVQDGVYLGVKTCDIFSFFFLARTGVWLLFNGVLALLFSLFYVIREFDKFLHRG